MSRWLFVAALPALLLVVACSSGNNNRQTATPTGTAASATTPTPTRQAATVPSAPSPTIPATVPATVPLGTPAPPAPTATSAISGTQAVENRLIQAALTSADVPQPLVLTAKRPYSNHDYASPQPDAASYERSLNDLGRISGALVQYQFAGPATPTPDAQLVLGLLDILSTWRGEAEAKAGLQATLKQVTASGVQPSSVQQTSETVDLSPVPNVLQATHLHITSIVPGQVNSDVYIIGLQHATDTALIIISGQNGPPTLDQVKQIVDTQNRRLG